MNRTRWIPLYAAVVLLCLGWFSSVQAQAQTPEAATLDTPFTTSDGAFRLQYPGSWSIHEREDGWITMGGDNASIAIVPPAALSGIGLMAAETSTAKLCLAGFVANGVPSTFHFARAETVKLPSGVEIERAAFTTDEKSFDGVTAAVALAIPLGDTCAIITAFGVGIDLDALDPIADAIADTFESGTFAQPGAVTGALPTLEHVVGGAYGSDVDGSIAELKRLELIPKRGELVYSQDMLISALSPGLQIDEKSGSSYTDFVMGALVSWEPVSEGDTGECALLTRVAKTDSGDPASFLAVAATSENTLIVAEKGVSNDTPAVFQTGVVAEFHNPTHILYIARGDKLTVFLNGVATIEDLPLKFPPDGTQKLFVGTGMGSGCVMSGVWAYGLTSAAPA